MPRTERHRRSRREGRHVQLTTAFAEILREGLAEGARRDSLEKMLAAIADRLGYPLIVAARIEAGEFVIEAAHGFPPDDERIALERGIAGEAARRGTAVVCRDARDDPRWVDLSGGRHLSGLALPMRLPDRLWGVLVVESEEVDAFGHDDAAALAPLADEMAWALESIRLREEAVSRARREEALRAQVEAVSAVTSAGLRATEFEPAIVEMVREVQARLGWESLEIVLRQRNGRLRVVSRHGREPEVSSPSSDQERGIIAQVVGTGEACLAPGPRADRHHVAAAGAVAEMCAPLRIAGEVRGAVRVESPVPRRSVDDELLVLCRLADQIGLVVHKIELLAAARETVARLKELDRMKSEFVAMTSHELRSPLTAILASAELLDLRGEQLPEAERQAIAAALHRQARVLARLVEDVLDAARIERGQLVVEPDDVPLAEVAGELASRHGDRIQLGAGIAGVVVRADPLRLGQVLANLVDNARKYAPDSMVRLDAVRVGETVEISVCDDGPGVRDEDRELIFDPFYQVGGEDRRHRRRGVGLGLAVARELARLMGGNLRLAAPTGRGATFVLTLPRGQGVT